MYSWFISTSPACLSICLSVLSCSVWSLSSPHRCVPLTSPWPFSLLAFQQCICVKRNQLNSNLSESRLCKKNTGRSMFRLCSHCIFFLFFHFSSLPTCSGCSFLAIFFYLFLINAKQKAYRFNCFKQKRNAFSQYALFFALFSFHIASLFFFSSLASCSGMTPGRTCWVIRACLETEIIL